MLKHITTGMAILVVSACASQFAVYDQDGNALRGYPVPVFEQYVKSGERNTAANVGTNCHRVTFAELVMIDTGREIYINNSGALLAKTGLTIEFRENGMVSKVSYNTEPAGEKLLDSIAGVVTDLLPGGESAPSATPDRPLCTAGEVNVRLQPLTEFMAAQ